MLYQLSYVRAGEILAAAGIDSVGGKLRVRMELLQTLLDRRAGTANLHRNFVLAAFELRQDVLARG
jgi:hypothetical protein